MKGGACKYEQRRRAISVSSEILAIIPARGGSKGVPRKNIRMLAGKPLVAWTIESAQRASCIDRLIVSTDDEEIADISKSYGADVPFLRPAEFAKDGTTDLPVYLHTLEWLEQNEEVIPDIVVWLRPTAPLRAASDIDEAVRLLTTCDTDWVRSVCKVDHHPYWMYEIQDGFLTPVIEGLNPAKCYQRQLLPDVYRLNGVVETVWRDVIVNDGAQYSGKLCPYVMPQERSVDLDTELDFLLAEELLKRQ